MKASLYLNLALSTYSALASRGADVFKRADKVLAKRNENRQNNYHTEPRLEKRASQFLNDASKKFVVDGTNIPDVNFDIGESYAGLLPISSNANESRQLYFWFFPSTNPLATDEILIWLNGGPGCSSLSGLLTENGPFLYQSGTFAPTPNPYSWSNLTNVIWLEQPVGVGYTQGTPDIVDEPGLAKEFLGFYKNFVNTFQAQGKKVYITGESYAGYYVPYIADAFINANDSTYYNLAGIAINDPIIGDGDVQQEVIVTPFVDYWSNLFDLNSTFLTQLQNLSDVCGYTDYFNKYLTFPPVPGPFPTPANSSDGCDLFTSVYEAALEVNPCFNIYHITDTCPHLFDVLGIVNEGDYFPPGAQVYFNRTDVQAAINAPVGTNWSQCTPTNVFEGPDGKNVEGDQSIGPANNGVLKHVIETTNNVVIGSGGLDYILPTNGTLIAIQNLTWNGVQGLQSPPTTNTFYVPYHPEYNKGALAGAGNLGTWVSERGLTFYSIQLAGHELPGYSPGAGYRVVELLLGRIKSLDQTGDFTTQTGNYTGTTPLGDGDGGDIKEKVMWGRGRGQEELGRERFIRRKIDFLEASSR